MKSNDCIIFRAKYSESAEQIKGIITKHWHILESDFQLNGAFKERPLMVYKRGKNLVHSYLPPLQSLPARATLTPTVSLKATVTVVVVVSVIIFTIVTVLNILTQVKRSLLKEFFMSH